LNGRCQLSETDYPVIVPNEERGREREYAGLCADCRYMRRIKSDRGSTFYFCERSETDPGFPKYPRLPVLQCSGFEPMGRQECEQ
jgi:hypothetical protein